MPRFTPVHGGGRYSYGRDAYGYGASGYPTQGDGYYDDRGYTYGDGYGYDEGYGYDDRAPGGFTFYDDMALNESRGRGYGQSRIPGTVIIEREPEFVADDEKLIGGSRARLPQRMLRCASVGSLVEREAPAVQWERQVQVERCNKLPWKRDANQCDALQQTPAKPLQRRVGWQQFEDAVVRSFQGALKQTEQPAAPQQNQVVVMQGAPPPVAGQRTVVTQQQQPKTQKYTVTVVNPQGVQPTQGRPQGLPQMISQAFPQALPQALPQAMPQAFTQAAPIMMSQPAHRAPQIVQTGGVAPQHTQMMLQTSQPQLMMSGAPVTSQVLQSGPRSVIYSQPAGTATRTPVSSRIVSRS